MQNNYFFQKHISQFLNVKLKGWKLTDCFSQNKDELIIIFSDQLENIFTIKTQVSPAFTCLYFPLSFKRANQNTINLFEGLVGEIVQSVHQHANERAFSLYFTNNLQLTFKLFGNKSNIIFFENGIVNSVFPSNFQTDFKLKLVDLERKLTLSFDSYLANDFNLEKTVPTLGRNQIDYLKNQYLKLNNTENFNTEQFWNFVLKNISDFSKPHFYVDNKNGVPNLTMLSENSNAKVFDDPIEAINNFFINYSKIDGLAKEKLKQVAALESKIFKLKKVKAELENQLIKFEKGPSNEEIANILMANMHLDSNNLAVIELFDFYRNLPILIKLKAEISLQKNAEKYYRKAKNEKVEIDYIKQKLADTIENIDALGLKIVEIAAIEDVKALRKYFEINQLLPKSKVQITEIPFKIVALEGWDIWIGKNAQNNDLLTTKYAKKDDLWLHARDVAGSHVIIRNQSGKVFPKNIVERAAELAAFYSKRSNDTVCPVIVTPKKFVRKNKNLPAGKVIIEKEETLLVSPKGP